MDLFPNAGPTLTAATSISPTHAIHKIEGEATITSIAVPAPGFTGTIYLIGAPEANADIETGGNIGGSSVINAGVATALVYDGEMWYPVR